MEDILELENPDLLVSNRMTRFKDSGWYQRDNMPAVLVLGCGSIGSFLSLCLSRTECPLYLYDMDTFDEVNFSGQLCKKGDGGKLKTTALIETLALLNDGVNYVQDSGLEYNNSCPTNNIVFSCFDNMKARILAFNKWKEYENREIFIDGRINAESFQVFFVQKGNEEEYMKNLFDDSQVADLPCTYKSTTHCSMQIASMMMAGFANYLFNKRVGDTIREIPFKYELIMPIFKNVIENVGNTK
jgi:molybdopterin/thiamine biosynthesis adenylyltransferase